MTDCKTKKKFKTKRGAEKALSLIWKQALGQGKQGKLPCRSYVCPICNKWHLTSEAFRTKTKGDK